MRSLGTNPLFLSTALRGVIAQRLIRTLCPACRMKFDLTDAPETFGYLKPYLNPDEGKTLYAAKGCDACAQTGYSARAGIFEVLSVDHHIRHLIGENAPAREIRDKALKQSMLELRRTAMLMVARGQTSTEEVFRVIPSEDILAVD
jgi:type II secretory ATPase GspE/PulE/Tfp pilus assembly ATPase PilB-like protein